MRAKEWEKAVQAEIDRLEEEIESSEVGLETRILDLRVQYKSQVEEKKVMCARLRAMMEKDDGEEGPGES